MGEPTFGVLGSLLVRSEGRSVRIGGPKPRAVLATLLLQPSSFVSVDLLTEVLWPGGAPRSAVANIRTYVRALRGALTAAGVATECVRTESSGYCLDVPVDDVDMIVFEQLLEAARTQRDSGQQREALRTFEQALALWRGSVLQDLASSVVWDPVITRLEELRSIAVDECLELRLKHGDYATLVAELRSRLTENPLREDLWRMHVLALKRAGRTTEAQAAYAEAEHVLAAELGVEPSPPLRAAGEAVSGYTNGRHRPALAPICQLPMDVPDFTGRDDLVHALDQLLRSADRSPVVAALSGAPGAGKSTVAVHVAHQVRGAFPDGQLFVDMGGMSDGPRGPADVLAEMLRGLGVIDNAIPADLNERAALFRSRLAQRRFLIVLDDAASSSQVRPLLPGTGGSAVLVTSRRRILELPAHQYVVGIMRREEARSLFCAVAGEERLLSEQTDADQVLSACGSLPLAVRIAGARLANRPEWTVRALAEHLQDERGRLDQLQAGELEVRASAELSYRHLPESAATAFRALGEVAGGTFPGWVAAAATGNDSLAERDLETLLNEHLVEFVGTDPVGQHRYHMHDLLRYYAAERATSDHDAERIARQVRVIDAHIDLAREANEHMPTRFFGVLGPRRGFVGITAAVAPVVRADPVGWFEAERKLLVAGVESAVRIGRIAQAAALAVELASYFDLRGYYADWLRTHRLVLDAVDPSPDRATAALLRNLGQLHLYQDRYDDALAAFERSRRAFRELGDRLGEAVAAVGAGSVHRVLGDIDGSQRAFTDALDGFVASNDRHGEAVARNAIASVFLERREPEQAAPWLHGALQLSVEVGDRHREAQVRRRLAVLHEMEGNAEAARSELDTALATFDDLSDTHCAAYVQESIGELCLRQGSNGVASAMLHDALEVQRQLGDRRAEASIASLLGELHQTAGRKQTARRYLHRSLDTWHRLDAPEQAALVNAKLRALR